MAQTHRHIYKQGRAKHRWHPSSGLGVFLMADTFADARLEEQYARLGEELPMGVRHGTQTLSLVTWFGSLTTGSLSLCSET